MNFYWKKGLIWVDIELEYNGNKYQIENCIVDTGSASTAIDIDFIEFDYNQITQIKKLSGIGGIEEVMSQKVESLILGDIKINNLQIEFGNLQNSYGINGFIGTNILSQFQVNIDFSNQKINFISPLS
jgi:predicted aspartyl protease